MSTKPKQDWISLAVDLGDSLFRALVTQNILKYRTWRCARAKAYLLRHDDSYRRQWIEMRSFADATYLMRRVFHRKTHVFLTMSQ